MTKRTFITIGLVLLGGTLSVPLMAEQVFKIDSPLNMVMPSNSCSNQAIALHGMVHSTIGVTINGNSFHLQMHTNSQDVTGTGLVDGLKYNIVNGSSLNINSSLGGGPQMEMLMNTDYDLISQGSAPNMRVRLVTHITVDANGNVTANFANGSTVCK